MINDNTTQEGKMDVYEVLILIACVVAGVGIARGFGINIW